MWCDVALQALFERVAETADQVADRFPLYADPADGTWVTTRRGAWTGGFWVGLLWLAGSGGGVPNAATDPRRWSRTLADRFCGDASIRGMTFWYGVALGARLLADVPARDIALDAARNVATSLDSRSSVDGLTGVVSLLSWANGVAADPTFGHVAEHYASRQAEYCLSANGSVIPGVWARGQAWAMLGFADAAHRVSERFVPVATSCAEYWLSVVQDGCPSADLSTPGGIRDSSAAAIAAVALYKLAAIGGTEQRRYAAAARTLTRHLVDRHQRGGLYDGCYDEPPGTAIAHELIWGDFFFACALAITAERLDPFAV